MSEQLQLNKFQSASKSLTSVLNKFHYYPQLISIGSQPPDQISNTLANIKITADSVLLTNGDVWRYFDAEQDIFNHPALSGKTVFLQTLGYTNKKYNDFHYHISFPSWYWTRILRDEKFAALSSNLEYGFSCLNNVTSINRVILGHNFYINNLLDDMIFSQNLLGGYLDRLEEDLNDEYSELDLPKFHEYKNLLPIILKEEKHNGPIDFKYHKGRSGWQIPFTLSAHTNAYCFICVESECEEYPYSRNINLPVITEKSFKAFQTRQLPLILGAQGHYAYLKSLGFEMMEDLLPSGYDDMPFLQKVDAVVSTVEKGREFAKDFYFDHLPEIQHNYQLVNSDKVENLILQRIKDMLN